MSSVSVGAPCTYCGAPAEYSALLVEIPAAGLPRHEVWYACAAHATECRAPLSSITLFPADGGPRPIGGTRAEWVPLHPLGRRVRP